MYTLVQTVYIVMQSRYMFHKTILDMLDHHHVHVRSDDHAHVRQEHHIHVKTKHHVSVKTRHVPVKTRLSCTC